MPSPLLVRDSKGERAGEGGAYNDGRVATAREVERKGRQQGGNSNEALVGFWGATDLTVVRYINVSVSYLAIIIEHHYRSRTHLTLHQTFLLDF